MVFFDYVYYDILIADVSLQSTSGKTKTIFYHTYRTNLNKFSIKKHE